MPLCLTLVFTCVREACSASCGDITPRSSLVRAHVPIPYGSPLIRLFNLVSRSLCRLLLAPAADGTFPTLFCDSFPRCLSPCPGGSTECTCLVLPHCLRPSPLVDGSASRFIPPNDFMAGQISRLQLFRYVQASEFARLPDRSYRCAYCRRAAETFTSEQSMLRYLTCIGYASRPNRQLAARGLSPRKIRSLVGCSPLSERHRTEE